MNKQLAESFRDLAGAAIDRVHSTSPTEKDDRVLLAVLKSARGARDMWLRSAAGFGAAMQKSNRDLAKGRGSIVADEAETLSKAFQPLSDFADDLAKAATVMDDVVATLEAVAAEPATIHGEPYRGVPLHLIGRALQLDSPTRGNA